MTGQVAIQTNNNWELQLEKEFPKAIRSSSLVISILAM